VIESFGLVSKVQLISSVILVTPFASTESKPGMGGVALP
jgi:hypothetical protein